jgi:hypothetical protein
MARALGVVFLTAALFSIGCASAERQDQGTGQAQQEGQDEGAVVQFIDIENATSDQVFVTARVGNSAEQRLGFLEPGVRRRYTISTGASPTGEIFLRARDPERGMESTQTLSVSPGETLQWVISF